MTLLTKSVNKLNTNNLPFNNSATVTSSVTLVAILLEIGGKVTLASA